MNINEIKPHNWKTSSYLLLLAGLTLLLSGYAILRYGGWWGEVDTQASTRYIYSMMDDGKLIPKGFVYRNGYGYQTLVLFITNYTGISIGNFQLYLSILLVVWILVPAWLAYRELTNSDLAASLSCLILFVQPEFLFPLLRGTHEKFTRGLMFYCLFLLLRSMRIKSTRQKIFFAICFYLCAYAMISFNTYMGTSFILAVILALGIMWFSSKNSTAIKRTGSQFVSKNLYVTISMLVIAFIFTFYAYPPAQDQLRILKSVGDRLALLALQVEDTAGNPYQIIASGWISMPIYYLVSLANWLLLGASMIIWLKQSYSWLIKRNTNITQHEINLWAFYFAFGFLGFISIIVDVSGAIAANLQHRMFPSFAMIAAPMLGVWLAQQRIEIHKNKKIIITFSSLIIGCLMILSVFKATDEPLLSNWWLFSSPADQQAISWAEKFLAGKSLWTGFSITNRNTYYIKQNGRPINIDLNAGGTNTKANDYLVSDNESLFAQRVGMQVPIQLDSMLTYDNGEAHIYHRRPVTPYQR